MVKQIIIIITVIIARAVVIMLTIAIDKDVKQRLQEVLTKCKEYQLKEKEMYSAMFNASS